ncbi:uncharacterized protein A1O9_08372 [Exophiala aquamarina CBS 119918]|uniref:HMA domain-containing protein n=1 Tax=Exophiala aquamarina CBS 119918 TaxID=1182545 RepID=A0A072P7C2_9EURO|nr:uncharacterized protein A1O9_08372 [Exophiala aquamarina CBS 119918]KEF55622.1 hypothetical protein A1O9_08372 [Exophiala aquamarina CBS 119918]
MACADEQDSRSTITTSHERDETLGQDHCCDHDHDRVPEREHPHVLANHYHGHGLKTSADVHISSDHEHTHDKDGEHLDKPCNAHLAAAMQEYSTYLDSARCICRTILASAGTIQSFQGQLVGSSLTISGPRHSHHLNMKEHGTMLTRNRRHKNSPKALSAAKAKIKCCDSYDSLDEIEVERAPVRNTALIDTEKAGGRSHILLNVTGMDCSGCANNLTRAIRAVQGTHNVKVTFVTGTAEFDLDTNMNELNQVIRSAQRATGYKLTHFSSDIQTIVVKMSATTASVLRDNLPRGVERCEQLSKTTYVISYDPCTIGAREILAGIDAQLAAPHGDTHLDEGKRRLIRVFTLTTAAFILTAPVVALEWGKPTSVSEHTSLVVAIVLATMVQAIAIPAFYIPAISSLIYNKVVEMDMLVVISITAAYVYSFVGAGLFFANIELETKPFFETSTLLISLVLFGRLLAAWARKRAVKAVSLRSLQTLTAMLINPRTGAIAEIDARLLQYGDTIAILPYSKIATDADVLDGTSEVDESMLTGESLPIFKTTGSPLVSGTLNGGGRLTARVSRLPGKNTITDIASLVEQAQSFRPHIQDLADKVAGYFIPVVCAAALVVFIVWLLIGLKIRDQPAGEAIGIAIGYCIAVLAISCPCALGLAVPMVLVVAGGVAARGGIIIKTADVIERGFRVTDVVFDKTGTLTEPDLELVEEELFPNEKFDKDRILSLIMTLAKGNKHPVSEAVAQALEMQQVCGVDMEGIASIPGCGVRGEWQGAVIRAGNAKWLKVSQRSQVLGHTARGLTMLFATIDDELIAIFGLKSRVRNGATSVIQELHRRSIAVHLVSGDARRVVENVAAEMTIPLQNVAFESSPAQKQEYIRALMDAGKITLFCGDGTNDAVAVAQANVGVQIESSSDVTRATADVILLRNLDGVVNLLDVSKAAFRRITFNFIWSAVYNMLAILLAAGAFVRFRIPPAYAGLGEIVSVLPVVIAALTQPKVKTRN